MEYQKLFRRSIKELENTFIKIDSVNDKITLTYQNPSIKDFLEFYLDNNTDIVKDFLQIKTFFWDQKISILKSIKHNKYNNLVEQYKENRNNILLDSLLQIESKTIEVNNIMGRYSINNNSKETKLLTLSDLILKNKSIKKLVTKLYNIVSKLAKNSNHLDSRIYLILKKIPNVYFDSKLLTLLTEFTEKTVEIEELENLISLKDKLNYDTSKTMIKKSAINCFNNLNNIDDYSTQDIDDLENIYNSIQSVCDDLSLDYPDEYYNCEQKIDDLEQEIAHEEDHYDEDYDYDSYKEDRMFEVNTDEIIDDIFDSMVEKN